MIALLTVSRGNPAHHLGGLFSEVTAAGKMYGLDASESRTASEKAAQLREAEVKGVEQARQLENPDAQNHIQNEASDRSPILDDVCGMLSAGSLLNGDRAAFPRRDFWEVVLQDHTYGFHPVEANNCR